MATESNLKQSSPGVRTYRGRTLEEILPQVRSELGADAIILREREGLVGGVGGFFAQRFIEVDARRGEGQSIDIYDDSPEHDLRSKMFATAEPEVAEPKAILPAEPDIGTVTAALPPEPVQRFEPRLFVPPAVSADRSTPEMQPNGRRFETGVFMERLREASVVVPDDAAPETSGLAGTTPQAPATPPPTRKPRATRPRSPAGSKPPVRLSQAPRGPRKSNGWAAKMSGSPLTQPDEDTSGEMSRATQPAASQPLASEPPDTSITPNTARPARRPVTPRAPRKPPRSVTKPPVRRPAKPAAPPRDFVSQQPAAEPTPTPLPHGFAPSTYDQVRQRPKSLRDEALPKRPGSDLSVHGSANGGFIPAVVPKAAPKARNPGDEGLRGTLARLLGGRRRPAITRPAPAKPIDVVAATELAQNLSAHGASPAWTVQVITAAGAHGSPLAGSLREAAEAEVARRIMPAPALPATGAAVAFIGAGGSGKTRCTAALASAYRRSSTLSVSVVALDNPEGARELRRLLADDDIPVMSLSGAMAKRAVDEGREGGLVIVDTSATTPTDPSAVQALGLKLEALELDATYVALPATLGPQAALRALASFGTLKPAAVTITHADETDQLAVAIEITSAHRIPLAYFHSGTDHRSALSAVDPPAVAQQLLPS